jgi:octaprenyl-diphosphate synthase
VAYQVFDDCQDVFGSEAKAGKSLGTDLAKGKMTLPMIELRRRVSNGDLIKLERLFRQGGVAGPADLRRLLVRHDILKVCAEVICSRLEEARRALGSLRGNDKVDRLDGCTRFLEHQLESLGQA